MKAHIVGGGFGGLAAAALLIRNAEVPGADITIYEADEQLGGGFFLAGTAESGYQRAGLRLRQGIPLYVQNARVDSLRNTIPLFPSADEFFGISMRSEPYHDKAHVFDRDRPHRARPAFRPELGSTDSGSRAGCCSHPKRWMEGRRIDEYFPELFFLTEFWFLWASIMGTLPQAQRDRVSALHEPVLVLVRAPIGHERRVCVRRINQHQNFHRTAARVAAPDAA